MMFGSQKSSLLVFLPHKYHECWHWKCQHSPGNRRFSGLDPGVEGAKKVRKSKILKPDPSAKQPKIKEITNGR